MVYYYLSSPGIYPELLCHFSLVFQAVKIYHIFRIISSISFIFSIFIQEYIQITSTIVEQTSSKVVIPALTEKTMNTRFQFKAPSTLALLLMAVFVISVTFKPIHVLMSSHHSTENVCKHSNSDSITHQHQDSCPVCDFEFCLFIPQNQFNLPQLVANLEEKLTSRIFSCLIQQSSHHFQLRAPPIL